MTEVATKWLTGRWCTQCGYTGKGWVTLRAGQYVISSRYSEQCLIQNFNSHWWNFPLNISGCWLTMGNLNWKVKLRKTRDHCIHIFYPFFYLACGLYYPYCKSSIIQWESSCLVFFFFFHHLHVVFQKLFCGCEKVFKKFKVVKWANLL
jgi:hypothetical protein